MKRIILIAFALLCIVPLYSQVDTIVVKEDVFDQKLSKLNNDVHELKTNYEDNNKELQRLLKSKYIENKDKYRIVKSNMIQAASTIKLLSVKTINLKSRNSTQELEGMIKDLNNPESEILGYSFNKKIMELVHTYIQPTKKSFADRFFGVISTITQSPVFTNIMGTSAVLNVANSVLGVVRSAGIMDPKLDLQKIELFERDLNKYMVFYTTLDQANKNLAYNIVKQKEDLNLVQSKTMDYLVFMAKSMNYPVPEKKENESIDAYMNRFFLGFDKEWVSRYFDYLESSNSRNGEPDYDELIRKMELVKESNNRLEELIGLINQFEFNYDAYFEALGKYNTALNDALSISEANKITSASIVNNLKKDLAQKTAEAIELTKRSINIDELLISKNQLKYSTRIF